MNKNRGGRLGKLVIQGDIGISQVDLEVNGTNRPLVLDMEAEISRQVEEADESQVEKEEVSLKEVLDRIMNKGQGIMQDEPDHFLFSLKFKNSVLEEKYETEN